MADTWQAGINHGEVLNWCQAEVPTAISLAAQHWRSQRSTGAGNTIAALSIVSDAAPQL